MTNSTDTYQITITLNNSGSDISFKIYDTKKPGKEDIAKHTLFRLNLEPAYIPPSRTSSPFLYQDRLEKYGYSIISCTHEEEVIF